MNTSLSIDYESDWSTRLVDQIYLQFGNSPNIVALVQNVIAPQCQELEDAFQSILTIPSIAQSVGAQLDVLGRIATQLRLGLSDSDYQKAIAARIAVNKSSGTLDDIYAVFTAITGSSSGYTYTPSNNDTSFEVRIDAPLTAAFASITLGMLTDSKVAGVRALLEWQQQIDADTFAFATATTLTVATTGSSTTTITVADTSLFPSTGTLRISPSISPTSVSTYTVTSATTFSLATPVTTAYGVGTEVELYMDLGQGFAVDSYFTAATTVGATTISMQNASQFTTGIVAIIDDSLPTQEIVTCTYIDGATISVSPALQFAHGVGTQITVNDPTYGGGDLSFVGQA